MPEGVFTAVAVNVANTLNTGAWETKAGLAIVREKVEWAVVQAVRLLLPSLGFCPLRRCGDAPPARVPSPEPELICAKVNRVVAFQQACELNSITVELPCDTASVVYFGATPATASCRVIPLPDGTESVVLVNFTYAVTVVVRLSDGTAVTVTQPVRRNLIFRCPGHLDGFGAASVTAEVLAFMGGPYYGPACPTA
jgi:hypothetical protein